MLGKNELNPNWQSYFMIYGKCPKILYGKVSDKMAYANSVDPDQTAQQQSDLGLYCLQFHYVNNFKKQLLKCKI